MENIKIKNKKFDFKLKNKTYVIDWNRVNNIDDIKVVLKVFDLKVNVYSNNVPSHFKELFDKGMLIRES